MLACCLMSSCMNVMCCACHAVSVLMHNALSWMTLWLYTAHALRPLGMVQDEAVALGAAVMAYRKGPRPPEVSHKPTFVVLPRLARAVAALTRNMSEVAAWATRLSTCVKARGSRHTAAAALATGSCNLHHEHDSVVCDWFASSSQSLATCWHHSGWIQNLGCSVWVHKHDE